MAGGRRRLVADHRQRALVASIDHLVKPAEIDTLLRLIEAQVSASTSR